MVLSLASFAYVVLLATVSMAAESALWGTATVNTSFGLLVGSHDPIRGCNSWLGVPYAEAPVGELRFAGPQTWTRAYPSEGYNAKNYGAYCPQLAGTLDGSASTDFGGDEDCLFLNVWNPTRAAANSSVMVWIHGGGFTTGASSSMFPRQIPDAFNLYDGCGLSSRNDVVVASMNYRLGPLGLMAFPSDDYASRGTMDANFGLRDQRAALQWLQRELPAFGGDPRKVTIFGESAGSNSVFYHLASPRSKGLFRAAICQSNGPLAASSAYGHNHTLAYAAGLNCSDLGTLRSCLRDKDTKTLIAAANEAGNLFESEAWYPIVDGLDMPDFPMHMFMNGKAHQVPILAGTVTDEMNLFLWPAYKHGMNDSLYHEYMYAAINSPDPYTFELKNAHKFPQRLNDTEMESVFAEYATPATSDKRASAAAALTDAIPLCGTQLAGQWHSMTAPFYLYRFNHRSLCNMNPLYPAHSIPGVLHTAEIKYVFGNPLAEACLWSPAEWSLSRRIQTMWTNFAKNLKPQSTSGGKEDFPKYTNATRSSMVFETPADTIETDYRGKYCKFWSNLAVSKMSGSTLDAAGVADAASTLIV